MPLAVSSHPRLLTTKSVNLPFAIRQELSSYNTQEISISEESSATISLQKASDTTLLINTQTEFASDNCWSLHIDLSKTKGKLRSFASQRNKIKGRPEIVILCCGPARHWGCPTPSGAAHGHPAVSATASASDPGASSSSAASTRPSRTSWRSAGPTRCARGA